MRRRTTWTVFFVSLFLVSLTAGILVYLFVLKEDASPVEGDTDSNSNSGSTSSAASTDSPGTSSSGSDTTSIPVTDTPEDDRSILDKLRTEKRILKILVGTSIASFVILSWPWWGWYLVPYDERQKILSKKRYARALKASKGNEDPFEPATKPGEF